MPRNKLLQGYAGRRCLFGSCLFFNLLFFSCTGRRATFVCKPCNAACDDLIFDKPGQCPYCKMPLVKERVLSKINIETGSGYFQIKGSTDSLVKSITVFYYKPRNFQADAEILLVLPGSGRNAESYRNAWIEESEKYGMLILSLMYPERMYSFEDYHLGGLVKTSNLEHRVIMSETSNIAWLDEAELDLYPNTDPEKWIFRDFDRIFELAKAATNSTQQKYHLFGHSAGGHVLHRYALFGASPKVDKIAVCNPSFYTLPDFEVRFPFGLKNAPMNPEELGQAFEKKLILFLGELDNEHETNGVFLRSKTADEQGLHRLARGRNFFRRSKETAAQMNQSFNWKMEVVPQVGHDHRRMGDAVGKYLFEKKEN